MKNNEIEVLKNKMMDIINIIIIIMMNRLDYYHNSIMTIRQPYIVVSNVHVNLNKQNHCDQLVKLIKRHRKYCLTQMDFYIIKNNHIK